MPRMRCSAGMSSASATSGASLVSDTMSSTSWPSGSWKTMLCGWVGSRRSSSLKTSLAMKRSIQNSSES